MKKRQLQNLINDWKKDYERNQKIPTIASFFYKTKLTKREVESWNNMEGEYAKMYDLYRHEVVAFSETRTLDKLLNGKGYSKNIAYMFYLKSTFHYQEKTGEGTNVAPIVKISTTNKSNITKEDK